MQKQSQLVKNSENQKSNKNLGKKFEMPLKPTILPK